MDARSADTAGRPVHRPVGGCLAALAVLAPLAAASPALAADDAQGATPAAVVAVASEAPPAAAVVEAPAEAAVVEAPAEPVAEAPAEPVAEAPAEPPVVEAPAEPEAETPAEPEAEAPAEPAVEAAAEPEQHSADTAPDQDASSESQQPSSDPQQEEEDPAPADDGEQSPPSDPPEAEPEPSALAVAGNTSTVFQVIWQVQRGCETYCWGTSQNQAAVQWASTTQTAAAQAGGTPSSTAQAFNNSLTVQFAWQLQVGCMAFCYATSQTQLALQIAQTVQVAEAFAGLIASAENLASTVQQVWQVQQGCVQECYGASQSQTVAQGQGTSQSAAANTAEDSTVALLSLGPDGLPVLPSWLVAIALNFGATIQTILQYEEAGCLSYCTGDVQTQTAAQQALIAQDALATAAPPPVEQPPVEQPPVEQPGPPTADPAPQSGADEPPAEPVIARTAAGLSTPHQLILSSIDHDRGRNRTSIEMSVRRDAPLEPIAAVGGGDAWLPPDVLSTRSITASTAATSSTSRDAALAADIAQPLTAPVPTLTSQSPAASGTDPRTLIGLVAGIVALGALGASITRRRGSGS